MAINTRLLPRHLEAANEQELQDKFMRLQLSTHKVYKIVTIYPKGNKVYLWYIDQLSIRDAGEI